MSRVKMQLAVSAVDAPCGLDGTSARQDRGHMNPGDMQVMWDLAVVQAYGNDKYLLGGLTVKILVIDFHHSHATESDTKSACSPCR